MNGLALARVLRAGFELLAFAVLAFAVGVAASGSAFAQAPAVGACEVAVALDQTLALPSSSCPAAGDTGVWRPYREDGQPGPYFAIAGGSVYCPWEFFEDSSGLWQNVLYCTAYLDPVAVPPPTGASGALTWQDARDLSWSIVGVWIAVGAVAWLASLVVRS